MLSKKYKLTTKEIKDLFNKKDRSFFSFVKTDRNNLFDIKFFQNKEIKDNKFAVILSGKTFKTAIERNKIKRRTYSLLEKYEAKKGFFVLIYPKKEIINTKFQDLKKELYNIINNNI